MPCRSSISCTCSVFFGTADAILIFWADVDFHGINWSFEAFRSECRHHALWRAFITFVHVCALSVAGVWLNWKHCCYERKSQGEAPEETMSTTVGRALKKIFNVAEGRVEITRLLILPFYTQPRLVSNFSVLSSFITLYRHNIGSRVFLLV